MKIGYARVSTADQKFNLQTDALKEAGCSTIYKETVSGVKKQRPELAKALDKLRAGDILVVWKLDRLGRSLKELIEIVAQLQERKISFESISDKMNTSTSQGRLIFNIFGSLAEFERELIKERTNAGLSAARARGIKGGRKPGLTEAIKSKAASIKVVYDRKDKTIKEICTVFNISAATLYKCLRYEADRVASKIE
jgi:DNA invertase Pin-like site-specific DNA recombinase